MDCATYTKEHCEWCRLPISDPEKARVCDCPRHDGEEVQFCSRSCKVAAHG